MKENGLEERMEQAAHIVWATGGRLVPEEIREEYRQDCRAFDLFSSLMNIPARCLIKNAGLKCTL